MPTAAVSGKDRPTSIYCMGIAGPIIVQGFFSMRIHLANKQKLNDT